MTAGNFRFDRFSLDPADRQLRRDGEPVDPARVTSMRSR